jgi:hypothetical protein
MPLPSCLMTRRVLSLFVGSVLAAACASPSSDWSHAGELNTVAAYQQFLTKYPNDAHAAEAQNRIAALQDDQAWNTAQIASTLEGYQQYVTAEPNGAHVSAARDEITARQRTAAWTAAQTANTADALQAFVDKYPNSTEADTARDRIKSMAGYRAELATTRSETRANHERDTLARRFAKDLPQVIVVPPVAGAREYQVDSSPMSQQDAAAACASVRRAGQSCTVIPTSG